MFRRLFSTTAALTILCAGLALAQGKPNFSGTWVLDPTKSEGPGLAAAAQTGRTVTIVLKQTATELSVERQVRNQPEVAVFKLDGSESINKTPSGADIKSRTTWVGSTLVTKQSLSMGEANSSSTDVRSLSADGKVMTVEVTRTANGRDTKQKLVYNKQ